jgi:hypothetical protein
MNWRLGILLSAIVGCGLAMACVCAGQTECELDCRCFSQGGSCRKHDAGSCQYYYDGSGALNKEWVAYDTNSGATGSVTGVKLYHVDASYCHYSCSKTGQEREGNWYDEAPGGGTELRTDNLYYECTANS